MGCPRPRRLDTDALAAAPIVAHRALAVVVLANVTGMALQVMADVLDLEWRRRVVVRQLAIETWVLSLVPLVAGAWLLRQSGDAQGATEFVSL